MPKKSIGISLPEEAIEIADRNINLADCRSRNEFIEAAIRFYAEYLSLEDSKTIIPIHLQEAIKHAVDLAEDRMSKVIFKNAISVAMLSELIAICMDYDADMIQDIEQKAFDEVGSYNGILNTEQTIYRNRKYQ